MFLQSFAGGLMIGLAAVLLLLGSGQVAGVSGVLGGLVEGRGGAGGWRIAFIAGLALAPVLLLLAGGSVPGRLELGWPAIVGAGLLVGFGTQMGSGCTSGHGVCGLGNLSLRSLVAVSTFMAVAAITVFVVRHVLGRG